MPAPARLVVDERLTRRARLVAVGIGIMLVGLMVGAPLTLRVGPLANVGPASLLALMAGAALTTLVVTYVAHRYELTHAGRVELDDARVVFQKRAIGAVALTWPHVRGYRDDSADYIVVVPERAPEPLDVALAIPTRTEAIRTEVLAFLDARGLRRL